MIWASLLGAIAVVVAVGPRWTPATPSVGIRLGPLLLKRPKRDVDEVAAELVEGMSRALRAGLGVEQALEEVSQEQDHPVYRAAAQARAELAAGRRFQDALEPMRRVDGLGTAVDAMVLGAQGGGEESRALDAAAEALRDRAAVRADVLAQAAQARASAVVMAAAPVVFALLTLLAGGPAASFMLSTAIGRAAIIAALVLDAAGLWWMRRLIRGAAR
ncbi:MAG: type II secretion system F family protein [Acidimicrobiales bacterium]